jgi:hypothetical protein
MADLDGNRKGTITPQRHPGPPQSVSPRMTATVIYHDAVALLSQPYALTAAKKANSARKGPASPRIRPRAS